jgi:nitroreductase
MNVDQAIHARRSVRSFTPRVVDESTIVALLRAAVQAPSAMNAQPWLFAVIQDRTELKRYSDRAKEMIARERGRRDPSARLSDAMIHDDAFNIFYDAGTLVVVCAREDTPQANADCWLAAENLMLAACDLGLGTCVVGFAVPVLNTREVKRELAIPEGGAAVAPIVVGYPSGAPADVARSEPHITSWSPHR